MNLEQLGKLKYADSGTFQNVLEFVSQISNAKINPVDGRHSDIMYDLSDLREDTVRRSLDPKEALINAMRQDGKYFVVPQVVE
jgi:aspartyl/glutamyl-tRNA(Asn/Gln) amidotransferase C subunit